MMVFCNAHCTWTNGHWSVQAWVKHRWRLKEAEAVPEPADIPLDMQGSLAMQSVQLVMLVGLPGGSLPVLSESAHVISFVGWLKLVKLLLLLLLLLLFFFLFFFFHQMVQLAAAACLREGLTA